MRPVLDDLIDYGLSRGSSDRLADLRIGFGYTAARLESGKAGAACVLRHRLGGAGCSLLPFAGTLAGRPLPEILPFTRSRNVLEAAVGLAALNAAVDPVEHPGGAEENLADLLHIQPSDRVAMVGNIAPLLAPIRSRTEHCIVFDEGKPGTEGISDMALQEQLLPACQIAILSATCLLNDTFDRLLELVRDAREVCLIGPTTPMAPEVFAPRGVTVLAGRSFTDADGLLRVVSEAGGTRQFGPISRKVTLLLKRGR